MASVDESAVCQSAHPAAALRWRPITTAPKDGRWLVLRNDADRVAVGRWEPQSRQLGDQWLTYEWLVLNIFYDHSDDPDFEPSEADEPFWNHWADGYASGWMPLPGPPTPAVDGGLGQAYSDTGSGALAEHRAEPSPPPEPPSPLTGELLEALKALADSNEIRSDAARSAARAAIAKAEALLSPQADGGKR